MSDEIKLLLHEIRGINCSQDRAREILYYAEGMESSDYKREKRWANVVDEIYDNFGDIRDDYEYWHINDKF